MTIGNTEKEARKAPVGDTSATPQKGLTAKEAAWENMRALAALLDGKSAFGKFPMSLRVLKKNGRRVVYEIFQNNTAREVSEIELRDVLMEFLEEPVWKIYALKAKEATEFIDWWMGQTKSTLECEPESMAFKSDPRLCLQRMPFDITPTHTLDDCLAWTSFKNRMPDFDVFAMWVARIFVRNSFRKQNLYLEGPPDARKSVIGEVLGDVLGEASIHSNTEQAEARFFARQLVGKSLCVMDDVEGRFTNGKTFLSMTGTDRRTVEEKWGGYFAAQYTFRFLFLSNDPPEGIRKPQVKTRLILCKIMSPSASGENDPWGEDSKRSELKERLFAEFPKFLGYGMQLFTTLGIDPAEGRLPEATGVCEDQIRVYEEQARTVFERYFEATDDQSCMLERKEVEDIVTLVMHGRDVTRMSVCKLIWKRAYGVVETQISRGKNPTTGNPHRPVVYTMRRKEQAKGDLAQPDTHTGVYFA